VAEYYASILGEYSSLTLLFQRSMHLRPRQKARINTMKTGRLTQGQSAGEKSSLI